MAEIIQVDEKFEELRRKWFAVTIIFLTFLNP